MHAIFSCTGSYSRRLQPCGSLQHAAVMGESGKALVGADSSLEDTAVRTIAATINFTVIKSPEMQRDVGRDVRALGLYSIANTVLMPDWSRAYSTRCNAVTVGLHLAQSSTAEGIRIGRKVSDPHLRSIFIWMWQMCFYQSSDHHIPATSSSSLLTPSAAAVTGGRILR